MISKRENPLVSILANVVIPTYILDKFSAKAPVLALATAISIILIYGLWSFYQEKKINYISVMGMLNISLSGAFILLRLDGIWFAVKEAIFPLLIGLFVMFSAFSTRPFLKMMLLDTGALNLEDINSKLKEKNTEESFRLLLSKATFYFSLTFYMSAVLNFLLAYRIFTKIPESYTEVQKAELLNQQLAQMTWMGYIVIFVPSIILFFAIMFYFFRNLSRLTDLDFESLVKT